MISVSGIDEKASAVLSEEEIKSYKGWVNVPWFSYPWKCVLRYPNETIRKEISSMARRAANNDNISDDPWHRMTYWTFLQKARYNPSRIKDKCEADCSAGIIANVRGIGNVFNIGAFKNIGASYTGNMRRSFKDAGFLVLTDKKYLNSDKYLLEGDILLADGQFAATSLSDGSAVTSDKLMRGVSDAVNPINPKVKQSRRTYYTTRKGDTLTSIAKKYDVSVRKIQILNGVRTNDVLVPGKKLRVK